MNSSTPDEVYNLESVCMMCGKKGMTKILPTMIPFFKEVIISSFSCPHCNYSNNEIIQAKEIQIMGIRIKLSVKDPKDYDRMVVKTDYATINFPEIQLEIPPTYQKAEITTIEGILRTAYDGLNQQYGEVKDAPNVIEVDKNNKHESAPVDEQLLKICEFIKKLKEILDQRSLLTFILDDPTGNSFVQNPNAPSDDPNLQIVKYERTNEQNKMLSLADFVEANPDQNKETDPNKFADKEFETIEGVKSEVMQFPGVCASCGSPTITNMKMISIPHFKELIIMASTCDRCGCKTTEVKPGGGIQSQGCKIDLHVESAADLSRDVVKSENCVISIPELSLELSPTTLGAKYTTIEGLLVNIKEQLSENPFTLGDSSQVDLSTKFKDFVAKLDEYITGKKFDFHLILDDPTGNSFLAGIENGQVTDGNIKYSIYDRSWDQNEELGVNDMKVTEEEIAKQ